MGLTSNLLKTVHHLVATAAEVIVEPSVLGVQGVVLLGAALVSAPWHTLSAICVGYLITIPFSVASYAKIRRQRAGGERQREPEPTPSA